MRTRVAVPSIEAGIDSCQPARAGAAQKLQQHGLRLIVEGVRRRDGIESLLLREPGKPSVAQFAACGLDAKLGGQGMLAHIGATSKELQPMMPRQIGDESLVGLRIFSPQPMIEVRNREDDAQLGSQLQQNAQQRDGVRPARHGNADAVARAHQPSFADVVKHLRAHE